MKKLLIISYYWPPGSGAGVQRWLKFAKYLPENDWDPVILTVDPEYATYPAQDHGLLGEIPPSVKVIRTKATDYFRIYKKDRSRVPSAGFASGGSNSLKSKLLRFIRGNFFIPDPRKGWNRHAFKKACGMIEMEGISHVVTTSPPHSTQLIGLKLKKKYPAIRWLADLRDPWTDIYYYDQFYHSALARRIDRHYEAEVLKNTDAIITVGNSLKELFISKVPEIKDKISVITNGFDEDDFTNSKPIAPELFTISYIGTLSDAYPVDAFTDAVKNFISDGNRMLIRFVGMVSPAVKKSLLSAIPHDMMSFIGYVSHKEAVEYMTSSSALLLIIPDHRSNKGILTGKLFEYIAAEKPILCVGPVDGDASLILEGSGAGITFHYADSSSLYNSLVELAKGQINTAGARNQYSRKNLTVHLAKLLERN